jgi:hypothetical protein
VIPILDPTDDSFLIGTSDAFDLADLAMALGALTAYWVMQRTHERRIHDDQEAS